MTINSKILVDSIEAYDPTGPVVVSYGATIPPTATLSVNGNANFVGVITAESHSGNNIISAGVVTASSFSGDASGFTNLPVIDDGKSIAFTLIG